MGFASLKPILEREAGENRTRAAGFLLDSRVSTVPHSPTELLPPFMESELELDSGAMPAITSRVAQIFKIVKTRRKVTGYGVNRRSLHSFS